MIGLKDIFPSAALFVMSFDETVALIILLLIIFASVFYILLTLSNLSRVFKVRDNSFRQNGYIFIKVVTMIILINVIYHIIKIII